MAFRCAVQPGADLSMQPILGLSVVICIDSSVNWAEAGKPVAFVLKCFPIKPCSICRTRNYTIFEYVFGNPMCSYAKKLLEKGFSCVFIQFLYANVTFYGLCDNLRILCTKEHQQRSGYACTCFCVHKNKHSLQMLKYLTGKQQSSMGLAKGLLSWHNIVAVLAKVLLELIFFLSVTTMKWHSYGLVSECCLCAHDFRHYFFLNGVRNVLLIQQWSEDVPA